MNLALDNALRERLARIRALGAARIRPAGLEADRAGAPLPPEHPFFAELVRLGLGRTRWLGGDEPGGGEEPANAARGAGASLTGVLLSEELAYWDRGVAVAFPGPGLGEPPILAMGTPEQKERFLGPFRMPDRPRWGSFAMTEPGAGSDVAAIRTACRPDGDHWVLDGDKSFAANASRADWIVVWATRDPSLGRAGHRAFVVERGAPGLGGFRIERKMGLKAYESTSFTLRSCRVPAANLLGGEEGQSRRAGFKGAMESFNATRPMIGAMAVGIGRAALDAALAFARERDRLGDPRVRDRLERTQRKLQAARLLCWRAAWLADQRRPNVLEASMAKAVAPTAAFEAAALGMELIGEEGGRG
ncbi:MAG TPA: acyl-CoA dehydrogenase family protein, partial [Myxococcota bacterium]|nr:acyl-CoA dehydrogenase family protein [Myxococcota bacterium]